MAELLGISEAHLQREKIQAAGFQIPGRGRAGVGYTEDGRQEAEDVSLNRVLLS